MSLTQGTEIQPPGGTTEFGSNEGIFAFVGAF